MGMKRRTLGCSHQHDSIITTTTHARHCQPSGSQVDALTAEAQQPWPATAAVAAMVSHTVHCSAHKGSARTLHTVRSTQLMLPVPVARSPTRGACCPNTTCHCNLAKSIVSGWRKRRPGGAVKLDKTSETLPCPARGPVHSGTQAGLLSGERQLQSVGLTSS